jgi:hypothetical protein
MEFSIDDQMNYSDIVMDDLYSILTNNPQPFPKNYTKKMKLEFIDEVIDYFTRQQMYEKCAALQKIREGILNENIGSIKKIK